MSDAQGDHVRPTREPDHVEGPDNVNGRHHRGRDADDQGDGEALHRAGPDQIEDEGREHGAHVRVDDRAHRVLEPLVDRGAHELAVLQLLPNTLEDQHVRVHGDAHRQHEPGEPRQRQREPEPREPGEREQHVQAQGRHGEHPRQPVVPDHDHDHQRDAHDAGADAVVDRVLAERGTDSALLDDGERRGQRAGAQHQRQVLRVLERLRAQLDLAVLPDLTLDDGRLALHAAVEDDGHVVLHVPAGLALEDASPAPRQREVHDRLVGHGVPLRLRLFQLLPRDDRTILDRVQRAVRARRARRHLGAPLELDPARRSVLSISGRASRNRFFISVMRNSRNAVRWMMPLARAGSFSPASSTINRSLPTTCTTGSVVPNSSIRVRTTRSARWIASAGSGTGPFDWSTSKARWIPPCRSRPRLSGTRRIVVSFIRPVVASRTRWVVSAGISAQTLRSTSPPMMNSRERSLAIPATYPLRAERAAWASRSIWSTSAWRDGNVRTSRRRRTHSTVTVSPYRSPAKSKRCTSRPRACTPNVGRDP